MINFAQPEQIDSAKRRQHEEKAKSHASPIRRQLTAFEFISALLPVVKI